MNVRHFRFIAIAAAVAALATATILIASQPAAAQVPSHTKVRVPDVDPELQRLLTQAQEAMDKKDYPAAVKAYSDYLAKKPDDAGIHFQLGYAYTAARDSENAAKEYRRATELDPKMLPAFVNLGLAYNRATMSCS